MSEVRLEHANVTVSDLDRSAKMLSDVFGWSLRWEGASKTLGRSIHVGGRDSYIALYKEPVAGVSQEDSYTTVAGLNHLAVVVDDLKAIEAKVVAAGYEPNSHQDYEPGERFYFEDHDGTKYEVVSYA
jgi:catechol 2,3-dioxygenase-like lactoylglutathione lyase family enzyme